MAHEIFEEIDHSIDGVTLDIEEVGDVTRYLTHITSARGAKIMGRPRGTYCNIEISKLEISDEVVQILGQTIKEFMGGPAEKLLIVGLGNSRFVADSLGPQVVKMVDTDNRVAVFAPGVSGVTGIDSTTAIHAIARAVRPSHIIIVDSLCCHEKSRLGNNFQLTSTGISPGSGVGRDNQRLDAEFLGAPVIAIGVPLVIYQPSLHYVVPKTIDALVVKCADVIVRAISISSSSCD